LRQSAFPARFHLAWFTDTAEVAPVTFTAGTVAIEADRILDGLQEIFIIKRFLIAFTITNRLLLSPVVKLQAIHQNSL
jgi:hypothetical protein